MARATDSDVRAYVDMEAAADTSIYIASASAFADHLLSSSGLSETILTQIEIFLAAHFAVLGIERGGIRREVDGDAAQAYQTISEKKEGLHLTRFGQQAIALDTTGILSLQGNAKPKARFRVVGSATVDSAS